jgi:hypothetical protein
MMNGDDATKLAIWAGVVFALAALGLWMFMT